MRTLALALVSAFALLAQESSRTPPVVTSKVEPEYSEAARLFRLEATSILQVTVRADGTPRDPQVVRYLGYGLDEKALEAVRKWKFSPGTKDGQPIETTVQVEVNFRLKDNIRWRVHILNSRTANTNHVFNLEGVVGPRVAEDAPSATATLIFDIGTDGRPYDIRVPKSSDDEWARAVADAVRKWQFTPDEDGRPFAADYTIEFIRGN